MNAVEKAKQLNLTGTPAEIVAVLNSLGAGDITRLVLGKFLREKEFLIYDGTTWYGSIQTLLEMSPSPIPVEHVPNIIALKSIITGTGGDGLATTQPVWAVKILSFVQLLATVAGDAGLISVFYDMAGGRPYASLTVEQYTALVTDTQAADEKQTAVDTIITRCIASREAAEAEARKADSTPSSIEAAANTAWGA